AGDTDAFARQNGLYTLAERGMADGTETASNIINAAISRVLSAAGQWQDILACAANPEMEVIISNTTEIGIRLDPEDAFSVQPVSFPGRLLAWLEERYRVFNGDPERGCTIVPTELIVENGKTLKKVLMQLAALKKLPVDFVHWLDTANEICDSLVDCIVPGKLPATAQQELEEQLGYRDALMIMSEPYRLWAIETHDPRSEQRLSFRKGNPGMILAPSIEKFRELKLRLLNATHTFSCGLALLGGYETVKQAMQEETFRYYVRHLMLDEIKPLITGHGISEAEAIRFAEQVLDRFANPAIEHRWISITAQYSSKMQMRCIPLVQQYCQKHTKPPILMALGFAAYLLFMQSEQDNNGQPVVGIRGINYPVTDSKAGLLQEQWLRYGSSEIAIKTLTDPELFGLDQASVAGFAATVTAYIDLLEKQDAILVLRSILAAKSYS
ncbi:MAG TPA: tagaturonate reductase, partial [Sediminibacterium sp.]|nr:tagaturonate reductase [Sediminibacterium sp.]